MSYGLVRQIGPWDMTANDWRKVNAPMDIDPSDYQAIRPGTVSAMNPFLVKPSPLLDRTVVLPPADDPRILTPGRRVTVSRIMGNKRTPLEGQGAGKALTGQLTEKVSVPNPMAAAAAATGDGKKEKMTPEEMAAQALNFGAGVLPYVLNPGLLPFLPFQLLGDALQQ